MTPREFYPYRLMDALSRALAMGCIGDVNPIEMTFTITFRDSGRVISVPYEYNEFMADEYLEDLRISVGNLEFAAALEAELQATRERALAKLTDAERAALGV